jgi:CRISPR/Cas system-associated endonuclease Cas1
MSWRIVSVSSMCKLDFKMDYLVVRNRDGVTRIHMSEIAILMLESTAISLTAFLLRELERRKIDVIFCDETRTPYGMLASLYGSHDLSICPPYCWNGCGCIELSLERSCLSCMD